ncbi:1-acylglycerol-3-phosphate O-acyltransferase [Aureococcus anophagefferens]|nr:1-acylglycerol-3-phosphate O-acyltransferase [Aureococcus anophagefferens]
MGAPKNALQLPMKLEDYKPVSYATTACLFAIAIAGWVATWCAQMAFTYSTRTSWTPTKAMTDGKSPVMVICNHRSYMDPFALASALLPLETKYVAKSDLFKVPFGGWAMKNAGDLAVRFDANKNAGWGTVKGARASSAARRLLRASSRGRAWASATKCLEAKAHPSKLMLFKPAFFDLCKKQGVPVVPVSMMGTDEVWPCGAMSMRPGNIVVHVGEPLKGEDDESDQAFCDAARMAVGNGYLDLVKAA